MNNSGLQLQNSFSSQFKNAQDEYKDDNLKEILENNNNNQQNQQQQDLTSNVSTNLSLNNNSKRNNNLIQKTQSENYPNFSIQLQNNQSNILEYSNYSQQQQQSNNNNINTSDIQLNQSGLRKSSEILVSQNYQNNDNNKKKILRKTYTFDESQKEQTILCNIEDIPNNQETIIKQHHKGAVQYMKESYDGAYIGTLGTDSNIKITELYSPYEIKLEINRQNVNTYFTAFDLSNCSSKLLCAQKNNVQSSILLYNYEQGPQIIQYINTGGTKDINYIQFQYTDQFFLTTSNDGIVKQWNLNLGECIKQINQKSDIITIFKFIRCQDQILTGNINGEIALYNLSEHQQPSQILALTAQEEENEEEIVSIDISQNMQSNNLGIVTSYTGNVLYVINISNLQIVHRLRHKDFFGQKQQFIMPCFGPQGQFIMCGNSNKNSNIYVWNIQEIKLQDCRSTIEYKQMQRKQVTHIKNPLPKKITHITYNEIKNTLYTVDIEGNLVIWK